MLSKGSCSSCLRTGSHSSKASMIMMQGSLSNILLILVVQSCSVSLMMSLLSFSASSFRLRNVVATGSRIGSLAKPAQSLLNACSQRLSPCAVESLRSTGRLICGKALAGTAIVVDLHCQVRDLGCTSVSFGIQYRWVFREKPCYSPRCLRLLCMRVKVSESLVSGVRVRRSRTWRSLHAYPTANQLLGF